MAKRQRRQDMAKRRTAAAQERMRIISQLAKKEKRDDDFGMRDEDWDVYKVINRVYIFLIYIPYRIVRIYIFCYKTFFVGRWRFRFRIGTGETIRIGRCFTSS